MCGCRGNPGAYDHKAIQVVPRYTPRKVTTQCQSRACGWPRHPLWASIVHLVPSAHGDAHQ